MRSASRRSWDLPPKPRIGLHEVQHALTVSVGLFVLALRAGFRSLERFIYLADRLLVDHVIPGRSDTKTLSIRLHTETINIHQTQYVAVDWTIDFEQHIVHAICALFINGKDLHVEYSIRDEAAEHRLLDP